MKVMFTRNQRGERRMTPQVYKFLLAAHIIVSVGWLGIVVAKLVLGIAATTTHAAGSSDALYASMEVLDVAFPPVAISTIVTGVLLSLGTRWGLLEHYWVVTKIVLIVGVITSAVQLGDRFVRQAVSAPASALPGQAVTDGLSLGAWPVGASLLIALSVVHALMLVAATVVSVYKPWGKTWFGRRKAVRLPRGGKQ